jgi:hypothetical protein
MRSTRGDIISQALIRVGNNTATLQQAARFRLNRILQEIYQAFDWPFLYRIVPQDVLTNGVVTLPADFVKPEDDQSLLAQSTGGNPCVGVIQEVDHRYYQHYISQLTYSTQSVRPRIWTIDYGTQTGQAFPLPAMLVHCTFRYKFLPPDVPIGSGSDSVTHAYDADIPTFPWDTTLTDLVYEWAQSYEVDPRRGDQYQVNIQSVLRARGASFPERSFPSTVPLDPVVFSTPNWGFGRGRP